MKAAKNSVIIGFWATIFATCAGHAGRAWPVAAGNALSPADHGDADQPDDRADHHHRHGDVSSSTPAPCGLIGLDCGRLTSTYLGVILAHTTLGIPFVIITVTATLSGFDQSLIRASASLGANPRTTFFKVIMPLILPGVISGALFAFVTSFDEVVAVLFIAGPEQQTIPRQMWNGIREAISPAILAVATILVIISIGLLATVELLRRRSDRLRGVTALTGRQARRITAKRRPVGTPF